MSENTHIEWTDSTHNFWRGCTKVSDGCKHCYAETLITTRLATQHYAAATEDGGKRTSRHFLPVNGGPGDLSVPLWGKGAPRIRAVDFDAPLRWNKQPLIWDAAANEHRKRRVFSLSLGDWLDNEVPIEWLADMLNVIRQCDNLDWLLVTKRPELWLERIDAVCRLWACDGGYDVTDRAKTYHWLCRWRAGDAPPNVMVLTSVENQAVAETRIPALLKIPADRRGLSCEPLLGPLRIKDALKCDVPLHWVIAGCESGKNRRELEGYTTRARFLHEQCHLTGVPFFHKQMPIGKRVSGDMAEWPADLRVREFYT